MDFVMSLVHQSGSQQINYFQRSSGTPRVVRNTGRSSLSISPPPPTGRDGKDPLCRKTQKALSNTAVTNDGIMSLEELLTSERN